MTILDEILHTKRAEVFRLQQSTSADALLEASQQMRAPRSLYGALLGKKPVALIAEVKKASPSKGVIQPDFRPVEQAAAYMQGGASAISVVTDRQYFQGSGDVLRAVAQVATVPILRKDFIIDELQVYESRAMGADAILLIAAALADEEMTRLYQLARDLRMDVLIEVHSVHEWERVAPLEPALVGVNNRDLKTFQVDLARTSEVAQAIAAEVVLVSESGIATHEDVLRVQAAGAHAILVGETLMRSGVAGVARGIDQLLKEGAV